MSGIEHYEILVIGSGEAGKHLAGVHSEFHYFEGYVPANGFTLLGQVHGTHASFA